MTATTLAPKYWTKMRAGHYAGLVHPTPTTTVRFDVFYEDEYKLWYCTRNQGSVFDCANTLREAKTLCREEV